MLNASKMAAEEYVSCELQGILEEFARIRDAYLGLKAYCETQDETMTMEKERADRTKENLEKLSKTYLLLEKRYKTTVVELQTEKNNLLRTIEDLKEQCDHLRLINTDRNGDEEQICKLKEEIEVLKAHLSMQEEKHTEDVALLKLKHSDELQRYKMLLQNAKKDSASNETKKTKGRGKNVNNNKKNASNFRWPELNVERYNDSPMDAEEDTSGSKASKRRKLFSEDRGATFDIV